MKPLSPQELKKKFSRRELAKDTAIAGVAGTVIGTLSFSGLNYLGKNLQGIMVRAEREIRELALDVKELSGSLERKLVRERKELEEHYSQGILKIYEELGIATPAELQEIEHIINNYEEFERHYNFAERARIFKDRIDRRLLALDETLESYQPEALRSVNDAIRKAFGKPSGEEGSIYRKQVKERLDILCIFYDSDSDNRITQGKVVERLNIYLENAELSNEEKELYEFLKQEAQKGNEKNIRHFIENYDSYSERQDVLLKLRVSLSEAESLYGRIQENKSYIINLQDLLKKGIILKQEVRTKSAQEVAQYREQIDNSINELKSSVNNVINELKQKGYDIETREDFIESGTFARAMDSLVYPIVTGGSLIAGGLAALFAFRERTKGRKIRSLDKALEHSVQEHNALADNYQKLNEESRTEKSKKPDFPEYTGGNDVY